MNGDDCQNKDKLLSLSYFFVIQFFSMMHVAKAMPLNSKYKILISSETSINFHLKYIFANKFDCKSALKYNNLYELCGKQYWKIRVYEHNFEIDTNLVGRRIWLLFYKVIIDFIEKVSLWKRKWLPTNGKHTRIYTCWFFRTSVIK